MTEIKLPRLAAAATEFNVGKETIIDFLHKKGFSDVEFKDTTKLTLDMYQACIREFSNDKAAKSKADSVEIAKPISNEKKKVVELEVKKEVEKPTAPVVSEATSTPKEKISNNTVWLEVKEEPKVEEVSKPQAEIEEPKDEKEQEDKVIRLEAPEIDGPAILGKIDLSAIDSSTKPKKTVKKKEETKPIVEEEKKEEKPIEQPKKAAKKKTIEKDEPLVFEKPIPSTPVAAEDVFKIPEPPKPIEPEAPVANSNTVENIEIQKLSGPKILGKIELPKDNDTRPKQLPREEKRKRIPLDKKGSNIQRVDFRNQQTDDKRGGGNNNNNNNRPQNQQNNQRGGGNNFNRNNNRGNNRFQPNAPKEDKEIDKNEIQAKIRETQAKLSGGNNRGKGVKAKLKRDKRREAAEQEGRDSENNTLQVTEFVTVSELASLMDVSFAEVIGKCMGLGMMVSINQRLDAEVIELVASEFGYEVQFTNVDDIEDEDDDDDDDTENAESRPPIVTIMGHVDHGKTSLLDYIRNANVVAGEAGGITQHIGAYEVLIPSTGKYITFLDTPGHEAFTAMRARGAKVTDIAVIVVAADDAVMPQTKEAISHAQAAGVPMIFAVNKIDKDGANPTKIYEQLSQMNLLVESWGGKYQSQELSAKKGLNVDLLLEKILLEAELLELKANAKKGGTGTIIEASLDKGRGYVATILVQNGTLRQGDLIVSGQFYGKVKAMFNERNQRVQEAPPSTPVVILGLNGAPQAGEKFKVYSDEAQAKEIANKRAQIIREQGLRARKHITLDEIGRRLALGNFKELNIIIKGDVDGSVEALSDSLQKLSTSEVAVKIILKAVGQISEADVSLAAASDAILIGFNVRPSPQANKLAQNEGVEIKQYSIIYKAIEEIKAAMEGLLEPKVEEKEVATVEIREVFKFDKVTVAGCYVTEGKVKRDHKIKVFRDGILIYPRTEGAYAELSTLKRFKDDVKEVNYGYECGLTIKGFTDFQQGDNVVAYEEFEVKRTL